MIAIRCPHCNARIVLKDSLEERMIKTAIAFCRRHCGMTFAYQLDGMQVRVGKITWEEQKREPIRTKKGS